MEVANSRPMNSIAHENGIGLASFFFFFFFGFLWGFALTLHFIFIFYFHHLCPLFLGDLWCILGFTFGHVLDEVWTDISAFWGHVWFSISFIYGLIYRLIFAYYMSAYGGLLRRSRGSKNMRPKMTQNPTLRCPLFGSSESM